MGVSIIGWPSAVRPAYPTSAVVTAPVLEPITLDDAKLRAGLDWVTGDPRDLWLTGLIRVARSRVEEDTSLALLTQTRDVFYDTMPVPNIYAGWGQWPILDLPAQSKPLQSVTWIRSIDAAGIDHDLDVSAYWVDAPTNRVALSGAGTFPTDLRPFRPWSVRIVVGWTSVDLMPPELVQAVGILTAHYATIGRDVTVATRYIVDVPKGYDDLIAPFRPVTVA